MQRLLYYPGFEPPNSTWLKFALLYCDNVQSIVPYERQHLISNEFKRILDSSDLVELYNPGHYEADRATIYALRELERIIDRPYRYSSLFNQVNTVERFRNPSNWSNILYRGKFTGEWIDFCVKERFGMEIEEGVLVSEELSYLFMTHLAKEVAARSGRVIATDNDKYDNYTSYAISSSAITRMRSVFARSVIKLAVPANIDAISIGKLIDFRNSNRGLISAFNEELNNFNDCISNGSEAREFINKFKDINVAMDMEILGQGLGTAAIAFSSYILIKNGYPSQVEYLKESLGIVGGAITGFCAMRNSMFKPSNKRSCEKYFVKLNRLN